AGSRKPRGKRAPQHLARRSEEAESDSLRRGEKLRRADRLGVEYLQDVSQVPAGGVAVSGDNSGQNPVAERHADARPGGGDGQPWGNAVGEILADRNRQSHRNRSRKGGRRFRAHRGDSRRRDRSGPNEPDIAGSDASPPLRLGEQRTFGILLV